MITRFSVWLLVDATPSATPAATGTDTPQDSFEWGPAGPIVVGLLGLLLSLTTFVVTQRRADRVKEDAIAEADRDRKHELQEAAKARDAALSMLNRQLEAQAEDTATREGRADERQRLDLAHARTLMMTERYGRAAEQIGHRAAAVRIAGVHAMADLADEWDGRGRQQCVNVLCGYLRLPLPDEEGEDHVRGVVVGLIREHLQDDAAMNWSELDFDLSYGQFPGPATLFQGAVFNGKALFHHAAFKGTVSFDEARFNGYSSFAHATFDGRASFVGAMFDRLPPPEPRRTVDDVHARFGGATFKGDASFTRALFGEMFEDPRVPIGRSHSRKSSNMNVQFDRAVFFGQARFERAEFVGRTDFTRAEFRSDFRLRGTVFRGDARLHLGDAMLQTSVDLTHVTGLGRVQLPDGSTVAATGLRMIPANAALPDKDETGEARREPEPETES